MCIQRWNSALLLVALRGVAAALTGLIDLVRLVLAALLTLVLAGLVLLTGALAALPALVALLTPLRDILAALLLLAAALILLVHDDLLEEGIGGLPMMKERQTPYPQGRMPLLLKRPLPRQCLACPGQSGESQTDRDSF